jgi:tetratricopeptide (TPR) repeat protein
LGLTVGDGLVEAWEILSSGPERVSPALVDSLSRVTGYFSLQSEQEPPAEIARGINDQLAHLHGLLGQSITDDLRRRLLSVTGETALLAGRNAFRQGLPRLAADRFSMAVGLANEAGDRELRAAVLASVSGFSMSGLYGLQGNGPVAVDLMDEALQIVGPRANPQLKVVLWAGRAERYAVLGNLMGCMLDLHRAGNLLLMEGPFEHGLLQPHDMAGLDAIHGSCAVRLAAVAPTEARSAVDLLARSYRDLPSSHTSWRATVLADQGAAYALQGEAEQAAATLMEALELTHRAGARHNVPRIATILHTRLADVEVSAVRELDERLRAGGVS